MSWRNLKPWVQLVAAQCGDTAPAFPGGMAPDPARPNARGDLWPERERLPADLAALLERLAPLPVDGSGPGAGRRWLALLCIDLDLSAAAADTPEHATPAPIPERIHRGLRACLRAGDLLVALAPDRLLALLSLDLKERPPAERALRLAGSRMVASATVSALACSTGAHLRCSIGAALFNGDQDSSDSVIGQAADAAHLARERGGNQCCLPEDLATRAGRSDLHSNLLQALDQQQFFLHYQPEVDRHGRTVGAEALLRWHYPDRGTFRAGDFIEAAERTSVIAPLGAWVLDAACCQLAAWRLDPARADLTVTVNLSAEQLATPDFAAMVDKILQRRDADPSRLVLELTEHSELEDLKAAGQAIRALSERGVRFGLDNFGAGHSDLARLRDLPLSRVKISGGLLGETPSGPRETLLRSVVELSRRQHFDLLASRIERQDQRALADQLGCQGYQGLLFGRSVAAAAIA